MTTRRTCCVNSVRDASTWLPGSIFAAPMTASLLLLGGVLLVVEVLRLVWWPAPLRPDGRASTVLGEANYRKPATSPSQ